MVTETYTPLFHEIFMKVNNAKDKPKKIKVLQQYNTPGLRKILKAAFDPQIKWLLPVGAVPYVANESPEGLEHTRLEAEAKSLKNFVALVVDGKTIEGNENLNVMRREQLFIQLLEGLHVSEAEIVLAAKDKTLNKKYKGLNAATVKSAFGWDDNFMRAGVSRLGLGGTSGR